MPAPFEIRVIPVDASSWTPVAVPFDCVNLAVKNRDQENAMLIRTNPNDALTEDSLAPGAEQALAIPFHRYRFRAGTTPVWLKASAGTGPAVVKFLA